MQLNMYEGSKEDQNITQETKFNKMEKPNNQIREKTQKRNSKNIPKVKSQQGP